MLHKLTGKLLIAALCVVLLAACAKSLEPFASNDSSVPTAKLAVPLILISVDGVRHDYLEKGKLPNFERLSTGGLRADSLQHVFPTKTFVTHYSMVTGLHPDRTGVVSNGMWDPERKTSFSLKNRNAVRDASWYDGEPIWNTLEKAGKKTAPYFWPGSAAEINGMRPSIWITYSEEVTHDERVAQVLTWLEMPKQNRPEFLSLYFSVVDTVSHLYGPDHPKVTTALEEVDRALGLLLKGLEQREMLNKVHILITSDHGSQAIDLKRYILLDEFLDLRKVRVSDWGPTAHIWTTENGFTADQIIDALKVAHPNMRVWKKADVPPRYHFNEHKRIPDVVAEADLGWMISSKPKYERIERVGGMHGWEPALHNMHGIFIAHGPAFTAGSKAPALRSIDLYSLMAELMQVDPVDTDGSLSPFLPIIYRTSPSEIHSSNWICNNAELVLREGHGSASLQYGERVFSLPLQESKSGLSYADTDMLFWYRENEAQVIIDGQALIDCKKRL